jgi:hypothetical protein
MIDKFLNSQLPQDYAILAPFAPITPPLTLIFMKIDYWSEKPSLYGMESEAISCCMAGSHLKCIRRFQKFPRIVSRTPIIKRGFFEVLRVSRREKRKTEVKEG